MNEGRVEVYHNGAWGTVCNDMWDIDDANVVCRQLGYSRAMSAHGRAAFGAGSDPIHYNDVACSGCEARLADCPHNAIGQHDCGHDDNAGVVCEGTNKYIAIQLNCFKCSVYVQLFIINTLYATCTVFFFIGTIIMHIRNAINFFSTIVNIL